MAYKIEFAFLSSWDWSGRDLVIGNLDTIERIGESIGTEEQQR